MTLMRVINVEPVFIVPQWTWALGGALVALGVFGMCWAMIKMFK
jgi:hypothetical protein